MATTSEQCTQRTFTYLLKKRKYTIAECNALLALSPAVVAVVVRCPSVNAGQQQQRDRQVAVGYWVQLPDCQAHTSNLPRASCVQAWHHTSHHRYSADVKDVVMYGVNGDDRTTRGTADCCYQGQQHDPVEVMSENPSASAVRDQGEQKEVGMVRYWFRER